MTSNLTYDSKVSLLDKSLSELCLHVDKKSVNDLFDIQKVVNTDFEDEMLTLLIFNQTTISFPVSSPRAPVV